MYRAQFDEFTWLYARQPSHVDGHHHKHLCQNVLLGGAIPAGEMVRRDFSYWPGKGIRWRGPIAGSSIALWNARYIVTRYFFSLRECLETGRLPRVFRLARSSTWNSMTHPLEPGGVPVSS